jgi:hypothetical protein
VAPPDARLQSEPQGSESRPETKVEAATEVAERRMAFPPRTGSIFEDQLNRDIEGEIEY